MASDQCGEGLLLWFLLSIPVSSWFWFLPFVSHFKPGQYLPHAFKVTDTAGLVYQLSLKRDTTSSVWSKPSPSLVFLTHCSAPTDPQDSSWNGRAVLPVLTDETWGPKWPPDLLAVIRHAGAKNWAGSFCNKCSSFHLLLPHFSLF